MCLTLASTDLGPADVVLDPEEGMLVTSSRLSLGEGLSAMRSALSEAGVRQEPGAVVCVCGDHLWRYDSPGVVLPFQRRDRVAC